MPYNTTLPLPQPILPKLQGDTFIDQFDADTIGALPRYWTQSNGDNGRVHASKTLRFTSSIENRFQLSIPAGRSWMLETEIVRISGTPDESFQLYSGASDNNNKYQGGVGFSGSKIGVGKTVGGTFSSLSTTGTISEVPVGVPVRFRMIKVGTRLTMEIYTAGSMRAGRVSITDTSFAGAMFVGFNSYTTTAKVTQMNYLRAVRLG